MIKSLENYHRSRWIALIVSLVLGPEFGMCYLNRGRLALLYLLAALLSACLPFIFISFTGLKFSPFQMAYAAILAQRIFGSVHCFIIASKDAMTRPLAWFARGYALLLILFVPTLTTQSFRMFVGEPFQMQSTSMEPSLNQGDYFFVCKRAYDEQPPQRGDIVVTSVNRLVHVKRVAAMPGDRIGSVYGVLQVNGEPLPDFHKTNQKAQENRSDLTEFEKSRVIPSDQYFLTGDHVNQSMDRRDATLGYTHRDQIVGKVCLKVWNSLTHTVFWEAVR